jgi:molybdate transport system substrate-binding protein
MKRAAALRALLALTVLLPLAGCSKDASDPPPVRVAAAANLTFALQELAARYQQQSGQPVTLSFAATGLLAKQIREGAPFDLFVAADTSFLDEVIASGACDGATKALQGRGRIALWSGDPAAVPATLADLLAPRYARIAIANPEHAPYGRAAEQALERSGVLEQLRPRLVYGENARQALQLAESGNVEVAVVPLSLVVAAHDGGYTLVPEQLHQPIEQGLVVCRGGASFAGGRALAELLLSAEGRALMARHGFSLPAPIEEASEPADAASPL